LRDFASDKVLTVDEIRAAWNAGDTSTAHLAAHSLKGEASTLGANALAECAERVVIALKSGMDVLAALDVLSDEFSRVLAAINAVLPIENHGDGGERSGNRGDAIEALSRLKKLLLENDGTATAFIDEERHLLAGVLTVPEIETLRLQLRKFQFAAALTDLSVISARLSAASE